MIGTRNRDMNHISSCGILSPATSKVEGPCASTRCKMITNLSYMGKWYDLVDGRCTGSPARCVDFGDQPRDLNKTNTEYLIAKTLQYFQVVK